MSDTREVWERYVKSWKVASEAEKRALLAGAAVPECVYRDPLMVASGQDELVAYMRAFHQQIPGGHFVTDEFMTHHGRSIARWRMLDGEGGLQGTGTSYGEYDEHGKLVAMTGFFEVPEQG